MDFSYSAVSDILSLLREGLDVFKLVFLSRDSLTAYVDYVVQRNY